MSCQAAINTSYRHSRRITRRSRSSFYRSFWLLPRRKREAMCALYAFARTADDLGDCQEPRALRTHWLDWWRQTAAINLIGDRPLVNVTLPDGLTRTGSPQGTRGWPVDLHRRAKEIMPALHDTVHRYHIPLRYLLEIVDGVHSDQQKTRFDTYEQVEHHCYLAASAVGLACLHIWGCEEPFPNAAAVDCGLAFQLTNILRDIVEDAERGRIYLPRQHYERHGLTEDDLLAPRPDDRLRCLVLDEAKRARSLFASGWPVWESLHRDGRPMFSMMWRTYSKLLDRIVEDPGAVAVRRVGLRPSEKISLISHHFVPRMFRRLPVPPDELASR